MAFDKSTQLLYWTAVVGYPVYNVYMRNKLFKECLSYPSNASEAQIAFVRNTLKEQGFPASLYSTIKINDGPWVSQPASMSIFIDPKTASPEELLEAEGIIGHEGSHIYNKDEYYYWAFSIITPFVLHSVMRAGACKHEGLMTTKKSVARVLPALANLALSSFISIMYARYQESQADAGAISKAKNPKVLQAMEKRFYRMYKYVYQVEDCPSIITWKDRIHWLCFSGEIFHPHPLDRARVFKRAHQVLVENMNNTKE